MSSKAVWYLSRKESLGLCDISIAVDKEAYTIVYIQSCGEGICFYAYMTVTLIADFSKCHFSYNVFSVDRGVKP